MLDRLSFFGCLLYADNVILPSAAVSGLQRMMYCCYDVSCLLSSTFNGTKSYCFYVGKMLSLSYRIYF